jgi:hypothetical protein
MITEYTSGCSSTKRAVYLSVPSHGAGTTAVSLLEPADGGVVLPPVLPPVLLPPPALLPPVLLPTVLEPADDEPILPPLLELVFEDPNQIIPALRAIVQTPVLSVACLKYLFVVVLAGNDALSVFSIVTLFGTWSASTSRLTWNESPSAYV